MNRLKLKSSSSLKEDIMIKGQTVDIDDKDSSFNKSSCEVSAVICGGTDEKIFKTSPKEVMKNSDPGCVHTEDLNFDKLFGTLSVLTCRKTDETIFKSTVKKVTRKTETTNIIFQNSNFGEFYRALWSDLICQKKEGQIFKSSPKEVKFGETDTGDFHIEDSNFNESPSSTPSTLICHERVGSTFKSNSDESTSVLGSDVSSSDSDNVHLFNSYLPETDSCLEAGDSDSGSTCSLSEEECVKLLFDDELNSAGETYSDYEIDEELEEKILSSDVSLTDSADETYSDYEIDDELEDKLLSFDVPLTVSADETYSDYEIDDELEEKLLSFDVPLTDSAEDQTNSNFSGTKNVTLKRKKSCENDNEEISNPSKRHCLLNRSNDITPMSHEMSLKIDFQNVSTRFYQEVSLWEISELLNRELSGGENGIDNLDLPSIGAAETLVSAVKINRTQNDDENSNRSMIFSRITEDEDDNRNKCRKYDLEEFGKSHQAPFKRLSYWRKIQSSTSSLSLESPTYENKPPQIKCMSPKSSSRDESGGSKMKQVDSKDERSKDHSNASVTKPSFDDTVETLIPNISVHSSVDRRYFWEYLKRRTESLCATYEKIKNEFILSSHIT